MSKQQHGRLTIFQAAAVDDARLGSAAFRVLACLGTYSDKDGWAWPSQTTIATRLGISRQAVNKSIQQLSELGYLVIHHQYGEDGGMRVSRYRLCLDLDTADMSPLQRDVAPLQSEVAPPVNPTLHPLQRQKLHPLQRHVAQNVSKVTTQENDPVERGEKRAARVTLATYQPNDSLRQWAEDRVPGMDFADVVENWRDWHTSHQTPIKDYDASFRTWVRREKSPRSPTPQTVILENGREVDPSTARKLKLVAGLQLGGRNAQ